MKASGDPGTITSSNTSASSSFIEQQRSLLLLDDDMLHLVLSHFDVQTLIEKKQVCHDWKRIGTQVIDAKQTKSFVTNQELRRAVKKYCGYRDGRSYIYNHDSSAGGNPDVAEEFAVTYGYPIAKWDVSELEDFSHVFVCMEVFNEELSK